MQLCVDSVYICGNVFLAKIKTVKGIMIVSAFGLCFLVQAIYCSISHIPGCRKKKAYQHIKVCLPNWSVSNTW